jgi:hypothetical protein
MLISKYFNNYEKFLIINLIVKFYRNHLLGVEVLDTDQVEWIEYNILGS